jgi:hypothetical protein
LNIIENRQLAQGLDSSAFCSWNKDIVSNRNIRLAILFDEATAIISLPELRNKGFSDFFIPGIKIAIEVTQFF